jgi:hypothetical protein
MTQRLDEISTILRDGAKAGDWPLKSPESSARLIPDGTSRFCHPAMVRLDSGKSDLTELDALVEVLIAGLKVRG